VSPTEDGIYKGIENFQQAIEKDPTFALAYTGLADCYVGLGGLGFVPPKEAYWRASWNVASHSLSVVPKPACEVFMSRPT
jgi:hypothetical protein